VSHDHVARRVVYEERFGEQLDTIAYPPKMIIVASCLDDSTERMITVLADGFGVPVNAAPFQPSLAA
jgi:hypothetical protein